MQLLVACRWLTSIAEVFEKVSTSDLWAGEWLEGINNQLAFLVPVPWRCPIHMCYPQETSGFKFPLSCQAFHATLGVTHSLPFGAIGD